MLDRMVIRVTIQLDEKLDSDLVALATRKWGSTSEAAINCVVEAALTEFLEGGRDFLVSQSPAEQDWDLETPTGCFRIRSGRVEPISERIPGNGIARTLALMFRELRHLDTAKPTGEEVNSEETENDSAF